MQLQVVFLAPSTITCAYRRQYRIWDTVTQLLLSSERKTKIKSDTVTDHKQALPVYCGKKNRADFGLLLVLYFFKFKKYQRSQVNLHKKALLLNLKSLLPSKFQVHCYQTMDSKIFKVPWYQGMDTDSDTVCSRNWSICWRLQHQFLPGRIVGSHDASNQLDHTRHWAPVNLCSCPSTGRTLSPCWTNLWNLYRILYL